jgi:heptosyltransferase-1
MQIGIVRLTSLGDVVHTLPMAHAIRQHDPTAHIVWIVEEHEHALLRNNPAVDEVIEGPTRRWRQLLRTPWGAARLVPEFKVLRDRLRSLRLDVVIDVQGLPKSSIFTVLAHAPIRIGFAWRSVRDPFSAFFTNRRVTPPPTAAHVVDKNLSLLEPLGIHGGEVRFPLPAFSEAHVRTAAFLGEHGLGPRDRLVAVLPGTRGPAKQWPPERYLELARHLAEMRGVRVVLVGSPVEQPLLEGIVRGLSGHAPITFTAPIEDLVALLGRADVVVGNDTGPLHIGAALGRPTIGLFGPTRSERNGPYGPTGWSIQSPTGRMRDIGVKGVLEATLERLDFAAAKGRPSDPAPRPPSSIS